MRNFLFVLLSLLAISFNELVSSEISPVLFNLEIQNDTALDLKIKDKCNDIAIIKTLLPTGKSFKDNGDTPIYQHKKKFSYQLTPGKRLGLLIEDPQSKIIYVNAGRGKFNLECEPLSSLISGNELPEYNIYVNTTNKTVKTLYNSWRFKELEPKKSNLPSSITLSLQFYTDKQERLHALHKMKIEAASNFVSREDKIKPKPKVIVPISEKFFE